MARSAGVPAEAVAQAYKRSLLENGAVARAVEVFGGVDILVNNASAIRLTGTLDMPVKRYDLMHGVNGRGTFVCAQACLPHLLNSPNPHILTLSPPLVTDAKWFKDFPAYTIAKYTMSLFTLALASEFKDRGVAVNSLWPRTAIATAAVRNEIGGADLIAACRTPEIVADAAHYILTRPSRDCSGNFFSMTKCYWRLVSGTSRNTTSRLALHCRPTSLLRPCRACYGRTPWSRPSRVHDVCNSHT
ncbi:short chain dehydrogenase [Paraburkholderia steynii]|uniref:Short chain dehydrogenase n=1 Tax=Paraburkholderia steynii TaxID=1245441 RepID=A0A7Z7FMS2_9BURK|nr:short chain dehydrogenase [Paraburkholderia steynii]